MAATGNSCFRLVYLKKKSFSETHWLNALKLGRKHIWEIFYKDAHFVPIPLQIRRPPAIVVSDWLISKKNLQL
jgi:hypothetical protein